MRKGLFLLPGVAATLVVAAAPAARAAEPACEPPNVLILLDVSGSMNAADRPDGKYATAVSAIDTVVGAWDDAIRFGLMVFPEPGDGGGYCTVASEPAVPPMRGAAPAVHAYLSPDSPAFFGGPAATYDTPMRQAIDAAGALPALHDPTRASHVLLITDGMQDCCRRDDYDDEPDCLPGSTRLDPDEAAANRVDLAVAVARLAADGVPVYVVGFGAGVDAPALNAMAVAAGTARPACDPEGDDPSAPDACFHPVGSGAELVDALATIAVVVGDEVCNGLDDDCDGETDEGLVLACESACGRRVRRCVDGAYGPCEDADPGDAAACRPERDGPDAATDPGPDPADGGMDVARDAGGPDVPPIRIVDDPGADEAPRVTGGGCHAGRPADGRRPALPGPVSVILGAAVMAAAWRRGRRLRTAARPASVVEEGARRRTGPAS